MTRIDTLRPDAKGRITLGKLAKGVSSYHVTIDDGRIILEPHAEIPLRERWIFENKEILESLRRGLKDSAEGRVKSLGDFTKYIDDEDE
jgi:hypothetical protein